MNKVLIILGPTASGKTGIGVKLAKELNGEIISADSRQVYRGLNIGSGKEYFFDVRQWLIDIAPPCFLHLEGEKGKVEKNTQSSKGGCNFTLFDWLPLAKEAIVDILSRGKVPIVVGGTGLYIQALVEGFELQSAQSAKRKTQNDNLELRTIEQLRALLRELDPITYHTIDLNNPHRLKRTIERTIAGQRPTKVKPEWEFLQIGLNLPREELYKRIDDRVEQRFSQGMLEEVKKLLGQGVSANWLINLGLEYRLITEFLLRMAQLLNCSIADLPHPAKYSRNGAGRFNNLTIQQYNNEFELMEQQLKYKIHAFARRQLTWFRRFPEIIWLKDYDEIKNRAEQFL